MKDVEKLYEELMDILGSRVSSLEVLYVFAGIKETVRIPVAFSLISRLEALCFTSNLAVVTSETNYAVPPQTGYINSNSTSKRLSEKIYKEAFIAISNELSYTLKEAVESFNHRKVGQILGYPKCCIDFFMSHFALGELNGMDFSTFISPETSACNHEMNIFSKEIDASYLSHFPCSWQCHESLAQATERKDLVARIMPALKSSFENIMKSGVVYATGLGFIFSQECLINSEGVLIAKSGTGLLVNGNTRSPYDEDMKLMDIAKEVWGLEEKIKKNYVIFQ